MGKIMSIFIMDNLDLLSIRVYTGPRNGNPGRSISRKIRALLLIPAPYDRKPDGGGWGGAGSNKRFISGLIR